MIHKLDSITNLSRQSSFFKKLAVINLLEHRGIVETNFTHLHLALSYGVVNRFLEIGVAVEHFKRVEVVWSGWSWFNFVLGMQLCLDPRIHLHDNWLVNMLLAVVPLAAIQFLSLLFHKTKLLQIRVNLL